MIDLVPLAARAGALLLVLAGALASTGAAQTATPYGAGTAGSGGVTPRIWVGTVPRVGAASFAVTIDQAVGGAPAALLLSGAAADRSILGVRLLVEPTATAFVPLPTRTTSGLAGAAGVGDASWPVPIPNVPSLQGQVVYAQSIVVDGAASQGLAASDGLRFGIGGVSTFVGLLARGLEIRPSLGAATVAPRSPIATSGSISLSADGTRALVSNFVANGGIDYYDTSVAPAARIVTVPPPPGRSAGSFVLHPSGTRGYFLNQVPGPGSYAELWSMDLDPASPSFGRALDRLQILDLLTSVPHISADGRRLAVAWASGGIQHGRYVFDVEPGSPTRDRVVQQWFAFGQMTPDVVALSPNGGQLFVASPLNTSLTAYDVRTGQQGGTATLSSGTRSLTVDPRGRFLVAKTASIFTPLPNLDVVDLDLGGSFAGVRPIAIGVDFAGPVLTADASRVVVAVGTQYEVRDLATGTVVGSTTASGTVVDFALR